MILPNDNRVAAGIIARGSSPAKMNIFGASFLAQKCIALTLADRYLAARDAAQPKPVALVPGGLKYSSALPEFEGDSDIVKGYHCFIHGHTRLVSTLDQAYADAIAVCRMIENEQSGATG